MKQGSQADLPLCTALWVVPSHCTEAGWAGSVHALLGGKSQLHVVCRGGAKLPAAEKSFLIN